MISNYDILWYSFRENNNQWNVQYKRMNTWRMRNDEMKDIESHDFIDEFILNDNWKIEFSLNLSYYNWYFQKWEILKFKNDIIYFDNHINVYFIIFHRDNFLLG